MKPLLHSKLAVPPVRPEVVSRTRLLERLALNDFVKASLVCAPAGFGKTTLVSEWLRREEGAINAVWLLLDAEDNDMRRLLTHLFTAVRDAVPSLGEVELELLESAQNVQADSLLAPFLNRAADLSTPLYLVLDDYHLISNPEIHRAFDFLLEYAPPSVKLCLITRTDPPLKLARLRARGQLTELRGRDLRFTAQETADFVKNTSTLELSERRAEALTERTEGWAVGLQVAALSLAGREDSSAFFEELTHSNRFLLDYLLDEVFERQPQEVQMFLLKTSVLDKLCAPLCHAILSPDVEHSDRSVSDAAEMLDTLERANLFLRPLDASRTWFRYHQLFKDVLFYQLELRHPSEVNTLRRRAALWFAANGSPLDALEQLLAGGLSSEAADLLAEVGPGLIWLRGDPATLESWLSRLPSEALATRPDLLLLRAWGAHLLGHTETITPLLDEASLVTDLLDVPNAPQLHAEISALRGFVSRMQGILDDALTHSEAALAGLPETAYALRALVMGNLGEVYYLRGDLDRAHDFHKEESRLAEKEGAVLPSRFALWRISDIQTLRGDLSGAERTNHMMLNLNKLRSVDALGFADVQLGIIALHRFDLTEAERRLSLGLEIGRRLNNPRVFMPGYGPLAQTLCALGRLDEAQEVLDEGLALAAQHGFGKTWGVPLLGAWQAYLDLKRGEFDKAHRWVEQAGLSPAPEHVPFTHLFDALIGVRILLALGRKSHLETALALLELPTMSICRTAEVAALHALVLHALGEQAEALERLEVSVSAASSSGYVLTFVDEGNAMRVLLEKLKQSGKQTSYCTTLLDAFPKSDDMSSAPTNASIAISSTIPYTPTEDFSERELSVLRLMAGRLSNKEIARELDLSTNTVKWYAKGIFEKLGVHGRLKAASRAKEVGLL